MSSNGLSGARPTALLIEDEKELADEVGAELRRLGYEVRYAGTVEDGLKSARKREAAILLLDRMLHGQDGLSILEALRAEGVRTPILVISALSSVDERIRGLKAGGDDYLVKPFAMAELAARVEALLRRVEDAPATRLRARGLEMDLIAHTVKRAGVAIELQPREFKLLEFFMRRPGQTITRAMLLEQVWRYRFIPNTNVVDVHVGHLRRKIDLPGEPPLIASIRGVGFMFNADA
jgi:two-component system OmpR family response regulator